MANTARTIRVRFDGAVDGLTRATARGAKAVDDMRSHFRKTGRDTGGGFSGSFMDAVKAGFKASVPTFLSEFGSTFTSGLKGVISSPVIGPIIIAAIVGLAATIAPAIATVLGGALVLGIGAAITGIGVLFLAQNKKIQADFTKTFGEIKKIMTDAAKPLIPVLDTVRSVLKNVTKEFAPILKQAFQLAQGPLKGFIKDLGKAFLELKPAIKPLMNAFSDILRQWGPQLPGLFREISNALIGLARTASENSDLIAAVFTLLLKAIPLVINIVSALMSAFRASGKVIYAVLDGILAGVEGVINVVAKIPGPWQKSMQAAVQSIQGAREKIHAMQASIERMPKIIKLEGDIRDLDAKISTAKAKLRDPDLTKERKAKLNADIAELLRKKAQAQAAIDSMRGKTVTITVRTERQEFGALKSSKGRARGGPVAARRSYLVGERGPEILQMGSSSGHIVPNHRLGEALGGSNVEVKVFIGDQELKGVVRTEISEQNRDVKRRALAGVAR